MTLLEGAALVAMAHGDATALDALHRKAEAWRQEAADMRVERDTEKARADVAEADRDAWKARAERWGGELRCAELEAREATVSRDEAQVGRDEARAELAKLRRVATAARAAHAGWNMRGPFLPGDGGTPTMKERVKALGEALDALDSDAATKAAERPAWLEGTIPVWEEDDALTSDRETLV